MAFPIIVAAAGSIAGLLGLSIYDAVKQSRSNPGIGKSGFKETLDRPMTTTQVTLPNGEVWEVASEHIGPTGIGEAADFAKSRGFQLPTPELVDAIWNAADLKLVPPIRTHDGTPRTMSSPKVYDDQRARIAALINGRQFKLLAGDYKDVVVLANGKPGLYGWNVEEGATLIDQNGQPQRIPTHAVRGASGVPVKGGRVIQQEFGGHGLDWGDYSQGLRLVRKVG